MSCAFGCRSYLRGSGSSVSELSPGSGGSWESFRLLDDEELGRLALRSPLLQRPDVAPQLVGVPETGRPADREQVPTDHMDEPPKQGGAQMATVDWRESRGGEHLVE